MRPDKETILISLLVLVIIILSFTLIVSNTHKVYIMENTDDKIVIEKNELKICCNYTTYEKTRNCRVLEEYPCSYCEKICDIK